MLGVGFVGVAATWVCFVGASCTARPARTHFSPVALKAMGIARDELAYSNSVWGRDSLPAKALAAAGEGAMAAPCQSLSGGREARPTHRLILCHVKRPGGQCYLLNVRTALACLKTTSAATVWTCHLHLLGRKN